MFGVSRKKLITIREELKLASDAANKAGEVFLEEAKLAKADSEKIRLGAEAATCFAKSVGILTAIVAFDKVI